MERSTRLNRASGDDDALEVDVIVHVDAWRHAVPALDDDCVRWARHAFARGQDNGAGSDRAGPAEVAVVLATDAFARALNRDYRGIDRPTNVLSFPAGDPVALQLPGAPRLLGDVVIAFETTRDEAARLGKPVAEHLCHLVVHGILHLIGYDHESERDAEAMERLETAILAVFHLADPYASDAKSQG